LHRAAGESSLGKLLSNSLRQDPETRSAPGLSVRWVEDRSEHLLASAHSRDHHYRVTAYADRLGKVLGLDAEIVVDAGAYGMSRRFSARIRSTRRENRRAVSETRLLLFRLTPLRGLGVRGHMNPILRAAFIATPKARQRRLEPTMTWAWSQAAVLIVSGERPRSL
jgi:Molybdopterin cofactor-binding domain